MIARLLTVLCLFFTQLHAVDIYFGTGGKPAEGIYHASFNPDNGKLSETTLAAEVKKPGFLALHPDRTTLYAIASPSQGPAVFAYRIQKDGSLQLLNSQPTGDDRSAHIAVHPSGKFLLTAQYRAGSVAVFPIEADGRLGPRAQLIKHEGASRANPQRQNAPHPHWVGFAPDGRFAFVPDLGTDEIVIYKVDADAPALEATGAAKAAAGDGPRHMRFSADGKFIYLLNELTLSVTTFAYDADSGSTQRLSTTPALSEATIAKESYNSASEILVHPSGQFVYSANRGHDSVTAYRADPDTGELTVIEVEPIRGSWPRNINMDASGRWLFAAGAHSNTVAVFEIDQNTGELQFQRRNVQTIPHVFCILPND